MISLKHIVRIIATRIFRVVKVMLFDPEIKFPENRMAVRSYSNAGEDLLIDAILGSRSTGTYVDIGANDPTLFNNTKRFYDRGWSGINIEPNPLHFPALLKNRTRDINPNIGIADKEAIVPFYVLGEDTASTLGKEHARLQHYYNDNSIQKVIDVPVARLDDTLDKYLTGRKIDFMSIDVEGQEMPVLRGNDWNKYRPYLILIEIAFNPKEIIDYLISLEYIPVLFTGGNGIFIDHTEQKPSKSTLEMYS